MEIKTRKTVQKLKKREDGATAIFVAITILVLMGFAAIAIDLGLGFNERRQDQTSADLAVIAGTLSYPDQVTLVSEVKTTANANVKANITDADWIACTDPARPAGYAPITVGGITYQCISANASFVRVKIPEQNTDTTFGQLIGFDSLTTDAAAEATILPPGGTGLLPFAVRAGSSAGELCLDTGTGNQITPPCDGNETGSFGNIAPPLFGNPFLGTSPSCNNQTASGGYVAEAIAMGIDHIIFKFTPSQWAATGWAPGDNTSKATVQANTNMDFCNDIGAPVAAAADGIPINSVVTDTGNSMKAASTEGLITGTGFADGLNARLTRPNPAFTRSVGRGSTFYTLDNTPLWYHLFEDTTHGLAYCDKSTISGLATLALKNAAMDTCLRTYQTTNQTVQIISDTILDSPRFGVAPHLWHTNFGSGLNYRPVQKFSIVYIGGMRFNDGSGPGTATVFYPDDADSSTITLKKGNWVVEQVGGYLILDSMVSDAVTTFYPGFDDDSLMPSLTK
jgi:hypothetical protein